MARRRSGKKIDFLHWTVGALDVQSHAAGNVATTVLGAQHLPETIMRIRGEVTVFKEGVSAPSLGAIITMGLVLVPEGTGTTVLWNPFTDGEAPWIWWSTAFIGYEEAVVDVVDYPGITSARQVIDSKAMRINKNMELQFVVENTTTIAALSVNVQGAVRVLSGT